MPAAFSIRPSRQADSDAVDELLNASYADLLQTSYDEDVLRLALPIITRSQTDLLTSGRYYLAETNDGSVIASGGWSVARPGTGETEPGLAHIRHFATHPDWTGNGAARRVFERCETDARNAGLNAFECYSTLNAEGFYRSLGFQRLRPMTVTLGNAVQFPSIVMHRPI